MTSTHRVATSGANLLRNFIHSFNIFIVFCRVYFFFALVTLKVKLGSHGDDRGEQTKKKPFGAVYDLKRRLMLDIQLGVNLISF